MREARSGTRAFVRLICLARTRRGADATRRDAHGVRQSDGRTVTGSSRPPLATLARAGEAIRDGGVARDGLLGTIGLQREGMDVNKANLAPTLTGNACQPGRSDSAWQWLGTGHAAAAICPYIES